MLRARGAPNPTSCRRNRGPKEDQRTRWTLPLKLALSLGSELLTEITIISCDTQFGNTKGAPEGSYMVSTCPAEIRS